MTPLAWVLGLLLPACGAEGAAGLPVPPPMDMTKIERPGTPNTYLAGPQGMIPVPDRVTTVQPRDAAALFEAARAALERQSRVHVAAAYPDRRQVHYVARSALLNFPDLVTVQVDPAGPGKSTIAIWSRSVYGRSDLGANKARVESWLTLLPPS